MSHGLHRYHPKSKKKGKRDRFTHVGAWEPVTTPRQERKSLFVTNPITKDQDDFSSQSSGDSPSERA